MITRLKTFIDSLGISVRAFEQTINASNGLIRKAISNNTDIQSKWLTSIAENYPQLNILWLLTGKGDMYETFSPISFLESEVNIQAIDKFLKIIEGKDAEIKELHYKNGKLEGKIEHLEFEIKKRNEIDVANATTSSIANAG